jgi:nicotinamide phosphoribosyltransferase
MQPELLIDGYKLAHRAQYPTGTTKVYSNWTPRDSRIHGVRKVVNFGTQYFLQKYLKEGFGQWFFGADIDRICERHQRRVDGYLGPNNVGVDHLRALHSLGYLPLEFRALPEGLEVPLRVPMLTVENTHPDFFWLTNYIESLMSCVLWLPSTSATLALRLRRLMDAAALRTGSPLDFVQWQGHDFSFRGMGGPDAAAISGAGHLLAFSGTDTLPALDLIEQYYGELPAEYLVGGSVPATEHSVMSAGGELSELETFARLLDIYPSGVVAVVSDTWDLWNVLTNILPQLKTRIMERSGKLVIRPDSGNPAEILCGEPGASGPRGRGVIGLLWDVFGGTVTSTGHKLLDSHIGAIYGDAINYDRADEITSRLAAQGFASASVVFGVGSYTYQYNTRDTFGFAMKATWAEVNGVGRDLFKKPITDSGVKPSAKGRLAVLQTAIGELYLVNQATAAQECDSLLKPVFRDGKFLRHESFDVIRERCLSQTEISATLDDARTDEDGR